MTQMSAPFRVEGLQLVEPGVATVTLCGPVEWVRRLCPIAAEVRICGEEPGDAQEAADRLKQALGCLALEIDILESGWRGGHALNLSRVVAALRGAARRVSMAAGVDP